VRIEEHHAVDVDGPLFAELLDLSRRSWKGDRGVAIATMPTCTRSSPRSRAAPPRADGWPSGRCVSTARSSPWSISCATPAGQRAPRRLRPALREVSPAAPSASPSRGPVRARRRPRVRHGPRPQRVQAALGHRDPRGHASVVYRPTAYGRLLHLLDTRLRPAVRRVRERLG
jgi:hypothetical protein